MLETFPKGGAFAEYGLDAFQRTVLVLETLRQRGNNYLEHNARKVPNVLNFEAEVLMDGRRLPRPVNYGLARILPPAGVSLDTGKRPFIVFDPRAGHGPGIGGMKHDSEIGVALRAGHPCYFVGFLPEPLPGQTVEDVCRAEVEFVRAVAARHPEADGKPVLIGNCQAGWQILMMAALAPEVPGPILVAGSPLSYWAGVRGKNPMRYLGGILGGSWLTRLASDLGDGLFDGAWLIANFEANNPANTLWTKRYNLYSQVDTEVPRYLEFEKWWGSPVLLNGVEMQFIVDELFVGNRLTAGKVLLGPDRIDLGALRSPIIVFCSFGDNITPPQQALDWILDLYEDEADLIAHGQTILYSLHPSVGHLGIFVSGKVARKEHEEFTFNMEMFEVMPPGLYEITLVDAAGQPVNPQWVTGEFIARVEPRRFADIRALGGNNAADQRRFETVARVSEINRFLYDTFLSPLVRGFVTPATAAMLREYHPNRVSFRAFSDHNPLMAPVGPAAEAVRANRHRVEPDNPWLALEGVASSWIETGLNIFAQWRDAMTEATFLNVYGNPWLQAMVGVSPLSEPSTPKAPTAHLPPPPAVDLARGTPVEAVMRALLFVRRGKGADERQLSAVRAIECHEPAASSIDIERFRAIMREQASLLKLDEAAALAGLGAMLPAEEAERARLLDLVREIATADQPFDAERASRFVRVQRAFGLPAALSVRAKAATRR
jgi:hypothetical protein